MVKKQQIQQPSKQTSALEQFDLGFEYNKTIKEVRQEVRLRTYKSI